MTIPRKAYQVTLGEAKKEYDITNATSKIVMAETVERAIEIAKDTLSKNELKKYYISEVELLVEGFDRD